MLYAIVIFLATRCQAVWPAISQSISALLLPLVEPLAILLLGPVGIALMINAFSKEAGKKLLKAEGEAITKAITFVMVGGFKLVYGAISGLMSLIFVTIAPAVFEKVKDGLERSGRSSWFSSFIAGLAAAGTVMAII